MQESAEAPENTAVKVDPIQSLADKLLLSEAVFGIARLQWSDTEVLASPTLEHGILISDADFENLAGVYFDTQKRVATRCTIVSVVLGVGGCALLVVGAVLLELPVSFVFLLGLIVAFLVLFVSGQIADAAMRRHFRPVYDALASDATHVTFPEALIDAVKKEKTRERQRAQLRTITSAAASAVAGGATILLGADKLAELAQSVTEAAVDHVLEQDDA